MPSRSSFWTNHPFWPFLAALAVMLAAFLLAVGLGPDRLPFPPGAAYSDAVVSHWPNALFLRRTVLDDHTWPLWRPLLMSGQPFSANPLNKVWYPPQWLVLLGPPDLHLNLMIGLHLMLAGAGAWMWSRATGLRAGPAALVGLGYAFAPRLMAAVGAGHLDLVYAAAWLPWLLWSVHRLTRPRFAPVDILAAGGLGALCFLADVRLSLYAFLVALAYLIKRRTANPALKTRRLGIGVLAAGLLAVGLTAVQWVPLLMLWPDLSRGAMTLQDAAFQSLTWGQWIGLLVGDSGGSHETLIYAGISTLVLAVVALLSRPRALAFWGAVLLVMMLYAMGDRFVLWAALNRLIPPLRWWRVPPRVWFIAALILPYLAGWGVQSLGERRSNGRYARLAVVALLGGGLACSLFSLLALTPPFEPAVAVGLFALPLTALALLSAIFGRLSPRAVTLLFIGVVAADIIWIDHTLVEGRHKREWLDPYRDLALYLDRPDVVRVYSPSYSLPQQAAAYWDIPQFGGVDPFQLRAYVEAAEAATGVQARGYSVSIPAFEVAGDADLSTANRGAPLDPDRLGQWLVTHIVSAYEIERAGLELERKIGEVYVYRNTRAPAVRLVWDGPNRFRLQSQTATDDVFYPVAPGRWRTVSDVYRYDSSEIWVSLAVGGIVTLLAAFIGWWGFRGGDDLGF